MPVDAVDQRQQVGEVDPLVLRQVAPVGVDVLAEQRHLLDAVGGQQLDLAHDVGRARGCARARACDGTMQYEQTQLQPTEIWTQRLERALALHRQVAREALELEVALRLEVVGLEELAELVDLARARRRRPRTGTARRPGPSATATSSRRRRRSAIGSSDFSRFASPRLPISRLSADSRIEQVLKRIRSAPSRSARLLVAERLEHALHALGVVLVHLAAEGGDVVAASWPPG